MLFLAGIKLYYRKLMTYAEPSPLFPGFPDSSLLPSLCLVRQRTQANCYERNFLPNPASAAMLPCPGLRYRGNGQAMTGH